MENLQPTLEVVFVFRMSPAEKQSQLVAKFSVIEDPQERLASIVEKARKLPPMTDAAKTDSNRVPGCVSRVWLTGQVDAGILQLSVDADSTLVKGLAWLVCETCNGTHATEVSDFQPTILSTLGLLSQLSPTRQNGLNEVHRRIRNLARISSVG